MAAPSLLLERETPLATLHALLLDAAAGEGRLALLAGEAGGGKTALVDACAHAAREARLVARVLRGSCDPLSTPRPLGPLVDVAGQAGGELARLLDAGAARFSVFEAFLALLRAPGRPTLVVVEDAHWADEATLDLLRFTGRRIATTRALLLVTYRDDEVGGDHPLRLLLGDLATSRAVRRIALAPLSPDAVARLVSGSGSELDAALLHARTGGNPFFVTEVLAGGGTGIPASVRDAVLARAARLSPAARALLDVVAVIGARAEQPLLAAVAGPDAAALDECVVGGMLRIHPGAVAFRHELARETILGALLPSRRIALHAAVLAALRVAASGPDDLARLADHAEQAGDGAAVLAWAPAAARRAASLSAHREAAAQYARALRFADALEPAARAALLDGCSEACQNVERIDDALAAAREAAACWRQAGDPAAECESLGKLAQCLLARGRNAELEQVMARALALAERLADPVAAASVYASWGTFRMLERDHAEAIAWSRRAIEVAGDQLPPVLQCNTFTAIGSAMIVAGDPSGRGWLERAAEIAREHEIERSYGLALVNLGSALGEMHDFLGADGPLATALEFTRERDLDYMGGYALAWQALVHVHLGRWDLAGAAAREVLARSGGAAISRIMALLALGRLRARRGDPDVWPALDEARTLADATGALQRIAPVRAARAEAAWLAGDPARALAEARAAWELASAHRHPWFCGELAWWRRLAGDADLAPPDWLAEPYRLQLSGEPLAAAAAWDVLGCPYEAARARGESDDPAALRAALATCESLGARPLAAGIARRLRERGVRAVPRGPRRSTRANPAGLTERELDVLTLLASGRRNQEIAERLYLSPKTVDHHVSAVLAKLGVASRTEAAREALRRGIVTLDAADAER